MSIARLKKQIEKIPDDGIDVEVHAWNARDTFPQRLGGGVSMKKLARSHDKLVIEEQGGVIQFVVYERKRRARYTTELVRTDDEAYAVKVLLAE